MQGRLHNSLESLKQGHSQNVFQGDLNLSTHDWGKTGKLNNFDQCR